MKKGKIVNATSDGKLYIKTKDFFEQEKIKKQIKELLDSDFIKKVDEQINKRKNGN